MCGRFVRCTPAERFADLFHAQGAVEAKPGYNIPPSRMLLLARNTVDWEQKPHLPP